MANKELTHYVEKHLEKGVRLREIKNRLAKAGHPIPHIEAAVKDVHEKNPHLKKTKPFSSFFFFAIIILIVVVGGFYVYSLIDQKLDFDTFKAELERNQTLEASADIDLLLLAKANDDTYYCDFIDEHNMRFACVDKVWAEKDCRWEALLGDNLDDCYYDLAFEINNSDYCYRIADTDRRFNCANMINFGMSTEEYEAFLDKQALTKDETTLEDLERVKSDYNACFELGGASAYCVFSAAEKGEYDLLISHYREKGFEASSWESLFVVYKIIKAAKTGAACSSLDFNSLITSQTFEGNRTIERETADFCNALVSGDINSCESLQHELFFASCNAYFTKSISDCAGEPTCESLTEAFKQVQ